MFTLLVLSGCLASALALPPISSVEPIATSEVSTDGVSAACALACTAMIMIPPVYLMCLTTCESKKGVNFDATKVDYSLAVVKPDFALKAISSFHVKECYDKCVAVYGPSGEDYTYCIIGCNLGEQKFVDKKGVAATPVGVREARGLEYCAQNYCRYVYYLTPAFVSCMAVCVASGGRRRSIDYAMDEMTPLIDIDFKKVPIAPVVPVVDSEATEDVKACFERCTVAYGNSGVDFLRCIYRCSHEDPSFEIPSKKIVKPVVDGIKREARDRGVGCDLACIITGPFYSLCVAAACG